jgi:hypothetical protein
MDCLSRDTVRALQNASDLHTLAISRASLSLVKLAYDLEPLALTRSVLQDAFQYGARREVLHFLVEKTDLDGSEISDLIVNEFLDAADGDDDETSRESTDRLEILNELVQAFPEHLISQDQINCKLCPVSIALVSRRFPRDMVDTMIDSIPDNESNAFYLHDSTEEHDPQFILNDRSMAAIGNLLGKIRELNSDRQFLTEKEFETLMALLVRANNATSRVHLGIWEQPNWRTSFDTLLGPARQRLQAARGVCPIRELSFDFSFEGKPLISWNAEEMPPVSMHHVLSILRLCCDMKSLVRLELRMPSAGKHVDGKKGFCDALCTLLVNSRLETLLLECPQGEDVALNGLYAPLLNAVGSSASCKDFFLQTLCHPTETTKYQKQMLKILETNTRLATVIISDKLRSYCSQFKSTKYWLIHCLDWSVDSTQTDDQTKISFLAFLNVVGWGKARDTKNTSCEEFLDLLGSESICGESDFTKYFGCIEGVIDRAETLPFVTNMQYGLLREAPTIWLPKWLGGSASKVKKREPNSTWKPSRKSSRKRKGPVL